MTSDDLFGWQRHERDDARASAEEELARLRGQGAADRDRAQIVTEQLHDAREENAALQRRLRAAELELHGHQVSAEHRLQVTNPADGV